MGGEHGPLAEHRLNGRLAHAETVGPCVVGLFLSYPLGCVVAIAPLASDEVPAEHCRKQRQSVETRPTLVEGRLQSVHSSEGTEVAKKRATRKRSTASSSSRAPRELDVREVEKQLDVAREALQSAEEAYARTRKASDERPESADKKTLGVVIDETLELVRHHPGTGVVTASAVGFLVGRVTRRLF